MMYIHMYHILSSYGAKGFPEFSIQPLGIINPTSGIPTRSPRVHRTVDNKMIVLYPSARAVESFF